MRLIAYFCDSDGCLMDREYVEAYCRSKDIELEVREFEVLSEDENLAHWQRLRDAGWSGKAPAYIAEGAAAGVPDAFGLEGWCSFEKAMRSV